MKTTVVPAQVTTVEDKIAGNLNVTQLVLLIGPVFLSGAIFALFPPLMAVTLPKVFLSIFVGILCISLAIRIKGKLVLHWIAVKARYNLRAKYYVFNKNDAHLRDFVLRLNKAKAAKTKADSRKAKLKPLFNLPTSDMVRLESAVADPRAQFHFKSVKGGLRVYIREVKEEKI